MKHRTLSVLLAGMLFIAGIAMADELTINLNLPSGNLATSVETLARQAGINVLFDRKLLEDKQAPALSGSYTPRAALQKLLAGSGLEFDFTGDKAVAIKIAPPAPPEQVMEMSPIEVRGAKEARNAEQEKSYVAPIASTGTKTDTPLMETPLAIQVVPQQVLQDQKVLTLDQALVNVSGVRSSTNPTPVKGSQQLYLRGFAATTTLRNGAWLSDEDGFGELGTQTMTNVESVEVMKGPAAILYGRVEPGGIVNIVTKKPLSTPYYSLEQMAGSWDHYVTNFDATASLNEEKTVLYRVNASYDTQRSWQDSVNSQNTFLAPTLQWKISPQTQVTLEAEYSHNPAAVNILVVPFDTVTQQHATVSRTQNVDRWSATTDKTLLELNWSHQFNDDWKISQRIAQSKVDSPDGNGYYAGFFGSNHVGNTWTADMIRLALANKVTTDATELNLNGHFDTVGLKHTLLLGADYHRFNDEQTQRVSSLAGPYFTQDLVNPTKPSGLSLDPSAYTWRGWENTHYGIYAQDQIKLPYGFDVLAGLRWQKFQLYRGMWEQTGPGLRGDGQFTTYADAERDFQAVTPRVGLVWEARDGLSIYGNYAENFGPNNARDWQGATLKPQSAKQYEVGEKSEFYGGKLTSSLALFQLTKTNMGAPDIIHDPAGILGYQVAVGEIRSRGVEFDTQGEIQPGWNIITSYTYTDIVVSKTNPGSSYVEGNRMPNVPRNMFNFSTTYELKGDLLHGWKIGGGVSAYDSATDQSNTLETPGYAVVNTMASYVMKVGKQKTTLQLNINNLFNKIYATDIQQADVQPMVYGTPRSAMASLKVEY